MRINRVTILLATCLWMLWASSTPAKGPVLLNVDIPAGKWKGIRLRNLPKDAVVAVQVESSDEILVALMDSKSFQRFSKTSRPLFLGQVEKKLAFTVSIPRAGDHFLVFDNRTGAQSRAVTVTIRAARGSADQMDAANKIFKEFERQFHQIFVFDPIPIAIKQCGTAKTFVDAPGVVLCGEYVHHLYDTLEDREKTKEALTFSLFHEVGRVLLSKWDHPFANKEKEVDQFATVLLVMLNQKESLRNTAEFFVKNPSVSVTLQRLFQDNRHPLSAERAQDILDWLKDMKLVRQWQKILVPHMQTPLLEKLKLHPTPWTDISLVEEELAKRSKTPT